MKNTRLKKGYQTFPLAAVTALLVTACASTPSQTEQAAPAASNPVSSSVKLRPNQILATVNGKSIAKSALAPIEQGPDSAEMESKMTDELIARELIAQEFAGKDLTKDPEIAEHLDNLLRVAYSQVASEQYIKGIKVSDEEIHQLYDQKKPELVGQQYKISHILLDNEAAAKEAIAKIQKGEKFSHLVKKLSKDPGSKANDGDLGWVDPRAMGPNFAHVLSTMKNGEVATQPVQSQYGWHVIMREDARTQPAPSFDAIKDKLVASVRMEKFQQHIKDLKAKAVITKATAAATP